MKTAFKAATGFVATLLMAAGLMATGAVSAAEPTYPAGSSIGLVPPPGMTTPGTGFTGFEDRTTGASIVIVEMPAEAYPQLVEKFTPAALKQSGVEAAGPAADFPVAKEAKLLRGTQTARGTSFRKWIVIALGPSGTGMVTVQAPEAAADKLSDAAVESALKTIAFRAPVGVDDQISALPFSIGDRAGFRAVRAIAGSSVYLTEGPKDVVPDGSQPVVIVAASNAGSTPPDAAQRQAFARKAFSGLNGVSDLKIDGDTMKQQGSAAVSRISGKGKDPKNGMETVVVQTVRFEGTGYIRTIGMVRQADAAKYTARFDKLAASVTPK